VNGIVFDLDGTLIHSAPDIHAAANRMLAEEGLEPLDLATITSFIGNGIPKLVERVMRTRGIDPGEHTRLVGVMGRHYNAAPADLTRPYPGLLPLLNTLKAQGVALGICTNKPLVPTMEILRLLDMTEFFSAVIGGDSLGVKKPDPAPLNACFETLGAVRRLYVGDSETDAETAERAGVPFALFTQGYRKVPVENLTHIARFDDFSRLLPIVNGFFQD
jgi:phosphoglycolate phosphatase